MQTPWFLEHLGLAADADLSAVRRAYAQRLKQIDQATDVPAFVRLRQAFEAAQAWLRQDQRESPSASTSQPQPARTPVEPVPTNAPHAEESQETAAAQAQRAMELLRAQLAAGQTPEQALLAGMKYLRNCQLDASEWFEALLVNQLAGKQLSHRLGLFHAAQLHLPWNDLTHLRNLGRRGEWILAMATEEFHWERAALLLGSLDLLDRMGHPPDLARTGLTPSDFPRSAALRWPDMLVLLARFPGYLALRADDSALAAWRDTFEALGERDRAVAEASTNLPGFAPDSTSTHAARPRRSPGWLVPAIVMLMMIVGGIAQQWLHPPQAADAAQDTPAPLVSRVSFTLPEQVAITAETCQQIEQAVHEPDWTPPLDPTQLVRLRDAVNGCMQRHRWPSHQGDDPALARLGINA